eukprot:m.74342 g.74342  ORF g.74342 m.74342 type:complete len:784 (+) comp11799_c0_seq1:169-2520(+)
MTLGGLKKGDAIALCRRLFGEVDETQVKKFFIAKLKEHLKHNPKDWTYVPIYARPQYATQMIQSFHSRGNGHNTTTVATTSTTATATTRPMPFANRTSSTQPPHYKDNLNEHVSSRRHSSVSSTTQQQQQHPPKRSKSYSLYRRPPSLIPPLSSSSTINSPSSLSTAAAHRPQAPFTPSIHSPAISPGNLLDEIVESVPSEFLNDLFPSNQNGNSKPNNNNTQKNKMSFPTPFSTSSTSSFPPPPSPSTAKQTVVSSTTSSSQPRPYTRPFSLPMNKETFRFNNINDLFRQQTQTSSSVWGTTSSRTIPPVNPKAQFKNSNNYQHHQHTHTSSSSSSSPSSMPLNRNFYSQPSQSLLNMKNKKGKKGNKINQPVNPFFSGEVLPSTTALSVDKFRPCAHQWYLMRRGENTRELQSYPILKIPLPNTLCHRLEVALSRKESKFIEKLWKGQTLTKFIVELKGNSSTLIDTSLNLTHKIVRDNNPVDKSIFPSHNEAAVFYIILRGIPLKHALNGIQRFPKDIGQAYDFASTEFAEVLNVFSLNLVLDQSKQAHEVETQKRAETQKDMNENTNPFFNSEFRNSRLLKVTKGTPAMEKMASEQTKTRADFLRLLNLEKKCFKWYRGPSCMYFESLGHRLKASTDEKLAETILAAVKESFESICVRVVNGLPTVMKPFQNHVFDETTNTVAQVSVHPSTSMAATTSTLVTSRSPSSTRTTTSMQKQQQEKQSTGENQKPKDGQQQLLGGNKGGEDVMVAEGVDGRRNEVVSATDTQQSQDEIVICLD